MSSGDGAVPHGVFLGVDIGGTATKWSLIKNDQVVKDGSIGTPRSGHGAVLAAASELITQHSSADLTAVGIALPGTVDQLRGRSVFLPNLPGSWSGLPVVQMLEAECKVKPHLVNDARAFAWAEKTIGAAHDRDNVLFITLGTGIGGAVALRGEVLTGPIDSVGEMGHFPTSQDGEYCACGGRGCLETVASATAIVGRLARPIGLDQSMVLRELTENYRVPMSARLAAKAARAGDPWARDAFERAGRAIGQSVSALALVLQLDTVVIGGGLSSSADLFLPLVRDALDSRISITGPIDVRLAHYGADAGSVGAAVFASRRFAANEDLTERTTV